MRPDTPPAKRCNSPRDNHAGNDELIPQPHLKPAVPRHRPRPSWTCACGNGASWSHLSSRCAWPNAGTSSSCHPSWRPPFCARNVSWAPWFERLGTTGTQQLQSKEGTPHHEHTCSTRTHRQGNAIIPTACGMDRVAHYAMDFVCCDLLLQGRRKNIGKQHPFENNYCNMPRHRRRGCPKFFNSRFGIQQNETLNEFSCTQCQTTRPRRLDAIFARTP